MLDSSTLPRLLGGGAGDVLTQTQRTGYVTLLLPRYASPYTPKKAQKNDAAFRLTLSRQFTFSVGYTTRLHLPHSGFMLAGEEAPW